jgi:hypothetical protein
MSAMTQEERNAAVEQWEKTSCPIDLAKDDHNTSVLRSYLQHCPTITSQLINTLIERHRAELHWLRIDQPKPADNRSSVDKLASIGVAANTGLFNHSRREDENNKTTQKVKTYKDGLDAEMRRAAYMAQRQRFYSLQGDTVGGRINHSETARLRKDFVAQLLQSFPDFQDQIRGEFRDFI